MTPASQTSFFVILESEPRGAGEGNVDHFSLCSFPIFIYLHFFFYSVEIMEECEDDSEGVIQIDTPIVESGSGKHISLFIRLCYWTSICTVKVHYIITCFQLWHPQLREHFSKSSNQSLRELEKVSHLQAILYNSWSSFLNNSFLFPVEMIECQDDTEGAIEIDIPIVEAGKF